MKRDTPPSRTIKADAARFRWWLKLWAANTDEAMEVINDAVSYPEGEAAIRAAIDAAIKKARKK
jgi:hypothetical protein